MPKFWRLALRILHSFRHHSFSIHIHYCLCSSPNYILFGEQQTPNRLSSHSPLSKNIIIGKTDGYFKNGQLFSFWLNLKARVSIRGQFHIEKYLNQFINNKLTPYCCLWERVLAANSPCAYSFTLWNNTRSVTAKKWQWGWWNNSVKFLSEGFSG